MKIISWNVNGLRARIKTGFDQTIKELDPDIVCIQETRCTVSQLPKDFLSDYIQDINNHDKAGYAGCGIWVKKNVFEGFDESNSTSISDENGRATVSHFSERFNLVNAYVPNSGLKLERLDRRVAWHDSFLEDMLAIKSTGLPFIYTGDLNCAFQKIDVGSPYIKSGISPEERGAFEKILTELNLVDIWRKQNPYLQSYTWFSNQFKSKEVNRGMRIDYFLISESLVPLVKKVEIIQDDKFVIGSDHQIVLMEIDI